MGDYLFKKVNMSTGAARRLKKAKCIKNLYEKFTNYS